MPAVGGEPTGYEQHAYECGDHPGCCVIVGVQDGRVVSASHLSADCAPETRLNLDHPKVHDRRHADVEKHKWVPWRLAEKHERHHLDWDDDQHHAVAYHAHRKGLIADTDAAATLELDVEEFHGKAERKRMHVPYDGDTPARKKGKP